MFSRFRISRLGHALLVCTALSLAACGGGGTTSTSGGSSTTTPSDTNLPTNLVASINTDAANTSATTVMLNISGADTVGVTAYFISENATTPAATDAGWVTIPQTTNYSGTVNFTLSAGVVGNNTKTVYVWFKDVAGNVSAPTSDSITLVVSDTDAPTSPVVSIDTGAATTNSTTVSLAISATDNAGVTAYFATENAATPAANDAGWTAVTPATNFSGNVNFTLSAGVMGNNARTVYVWFRDAAGNMSVSANDAITLVVSDTTAPTWPFVVINSHAPTTTSTSVTLFTSAADDVAVTDFFVSENSSTPAANDAGWIAATPNADFANNPIFTLSPGVVGNNTKTVYVWFKDAAGNVSAPASDAITLVVAAPTYSIGGTLTGLVGGNTVTLHNNGADPLALTANGAFIFSAPTSAYNVTVASTTQKCAVAAGGVGTASANVTSVAVDCGLNTFAAAAAMGNVRSMHSATVLADGKVLVIGGMNSVGAAIASAELYDPAMNVWAAAGTMLLPRMNHKATLLANGKVLVTGGTGSSYVAIASAELYDPVGNTWSSVASMVSPHAYHTATLMPNGTVLVVGGTGAGGGAVANTELYNPTANTWTATSMPLMFARYGHTATLMPNGTVLVIGGSDVTSTAIASVEVFNSAFNIPGFSPWSATTSMIRLRQNHTATLLGNGKVLVSGGYSQLLTALATAELYDPGTTAWALTPGMPSAQVYHTATKLTDGKVLVTGGHTFAAVATTHLYDPVANTWTSGAALTSTRESHTATLLGNGKVLICGGGNTAMLATTELYW